MNEYHEDASFFLRKAAKLISYLMAREEILDASLFFALGMERMLKGILYDINPIYVFKNQDFKHTAPLLYKSRLLPNASRNQEIASTPEADVLTFKLSLLRAKAFSGATERHSNLLFALANARDIIAHRPLSELDLDKLRLLMQRGFHPLVEDYAKEIGQKTSRFLGSEEVRLSNLSSKTKREEALEEKIEAKLKSHAEQWAMRKEKPDYAQAMQAKTNTIAAESYLNVTYEKVECPACRNDALITIEPEYDIIDREGVLVGVFVSSLRCLFCDLVLDSYEELDYVNVDSLLDEEYILS